MLELILISNDLEISSYAYDSGVDIIMIDLEVLGKEIRQKNFNMVQNYHTIKDIELFRKRFPKNKLIVRSNSPKYIHSDEIRDILSFEPDFLMIPFFDKLCEIKNFVDSINQTKTKVLPLFETASSVFRMRDFVDAGIISDYYIGLNDLRLTIGYDFLFEAVSNDIIDYASEIIKTNSNNRFGFGGISRIGTGDLPADLILAEHVRLNSNYVILSRAFHNSSLNIHDMKSKINLPHEIRKLREKEIEFSNLNQTELQHKHNELRQIVRKITKYNI